MWHFLEDRPIFQQIMERIQERIIIGEYQAGEKLASVRELAAEAGVNPNTMQKALSELEQLNLLFSHRTSGRFITEDQGVINELKSNMLKNKIAVFLDDMEKIGCEVDEAISIIKQVSKEGKE